MQKQSIIIFIEIKSRYRYNNGNDFIFLGDILARQLEKSQLIERSIIKKYRKSIWNAFVGAVQEYELIKENDTSKVNDLTKDIEVLDRYCKEHEVMAMAAVQLGIPKRIVELFGN